jgi:hypothetical protein
MLLWDLFKRKNGNYVQGMALHKAIKSRVIVKTRPQGIFQREKLLFPETKSS